MKRTQKMKKSEKKKVERALGLKIVIGWRGEGWHGVDEYRGTSEQRSRGGEKRRGEKKRGGELCHKY